MATISLQYGDGLVTLAGDGDVDINGANELTRALNIALLRRTAVVVDLSEAVLIDPAVISCLQVLARALSRRRQRLQVKVSAATQPAELLLRTVPSNQMEVLLV